MLSRPAVAIFALVVVEFLALSQLAGAIGGGLTFLVVLGLSVLGIALFRVVGASFVKASVATAVENSGFADLAGAPKFASGADRPGFAADHGMRLFGAFLLIVPGVVSGALGALLFLPPVRALARPVVLHRIQPWIRPDLRFGNGSMGFGRVVDVDVVDVDIVDDSNDEPPSPRAELS